MVNARSPISPGRDHRRRAIASSVMPRPPQPLGGTERLVTVLAGHLFGEDSHSALSAPQISGVANRRPNSWNISARGGVGDGEEIKGPTKSD
jgi:hypothetical protein